MIPAMGSRRLPLVILCYFLIYLVWGSTYYFIKVAVETINPFAVIGFRFFCGGLFFLIISLIAKRIKRMPTRQEWFSSMFMAFMLLIMGNGLVTIAERKVDSYIAALVVACTPVLVVIFNFLWFKKKPTMLAVGGICIGIIGVAFILYNGQSIRSSITPSIIIVLCAVVFWSCATSLGHRMKPYPDIFVSSSMQMGFAGIVCLVFLAVPGFAARVPSATSVPSLFSILSVFYLATIASFAFVAYNYLLLHEPAQRISSYALINPLIAVLIGILLGKEKIVPFMYGGLMCIIVGVGLIMYGDLLARALFRRRN